MRKGERGTPSVESFISRLQITRREGRPRSARSAHVLLCRHGLERHETLGNYLVPMLQRCGCSGDARRAFRRLNYRGEQSWACLMRECMEAAAAAAEEEEEDEDEDEEGSMDLEQAMRMYEQMQGEGVSPSKHMLHSLLRGCAMAGDVEKGQGIYQEMVRMGMEEDPFVACALLELYTACRSAIAEQEAAAVMMMMVMMVKGKDVVVWTAIIAASARIGLFGFVSDCLDTMQKIDGISPNPVTLLSILSGCSSSSAAAAAAAIDLCGGCCSAAAIDRGSFSGAAIDRGSFSGAAIDLCSRCCSSAAIDRMSSCSGVGIDLGSCCSDAAIHLGTCSSGATIDRRSCSSGAAIDRRSSSSGAAIELSSSSSGVAIELEETMMTMTMTMMGQRAHRDVVERGFEMEFGIGSALVRMYGKCRCPADAEHVFWKLPDRDLIAWTALISAYAESGLGEESMECLERMMQLDRQAPNAVTYGCLLKACLCCGGSSGDGIIVVDRVREIHARIVKAGFEYDPYVGQMLVDAYGRSASPMEAQAAFDWLLTPDHASWNRLISSYMDQGSIEDALGCLQKMQAQQGMHAADSVTCIYGLQLCGARRSAEEGRRWHAHAVKGGFDADRFVANALLDMYAKCSSYAEAWAVLEELPEQTCIAWTALIAGYIEDGLYSEAAQCLERMESGGITPDAVAFICCLRAAASPKTGYNIHSEIVKRGYEDDSAASTALVRMYTNCSLFDEGCAVLVASLVEEEGWAALMNGFLDADLDEAVLDLFETMPESLALERVSIAAGLKACGKLGALWKGQELHADAASRGLDADASIISALVDMYSKCGALGEAQGLLDRDSAQSIVLWTALMTGYACRGIVEPVVGIFRKMTRSGVNPDAVTWLSLITVCSHAGLVEYGTDVFEAVDGVRTIELHNGLIDMLARAGQIEGAMSVVAEQMPFPPNAVTWNTLLGACQKPTGGYRILTELGSVAFECAAAFDLQQHAPYISMFHMYADAQMWEEARRVECLRTMCAG